MILKLGVLSTKICKQTLENTRQRTRGTTTYVIVSFSGSVYLGLEMISVLVVEPYLGVVAVADAVRGDPVPLVSPTLGHDTSHQSRGSQVQLQPLMLCTQRCLVER